MDVKDDDDDDDEDLITLSGKGHITQWRFPKGLKKCPATRCDSHFEEWSDAIAHYKNQHAMDAILCTICDRPICVRHKWNFTKHYKTMHPGVTMPNHQTPQASDVGFHKKNDNADDLITLSGVGYITQWRFPVHSNECPLKSCREKFGLRSDAIAHYKRQHAMNAIHCAICDRPISTGKLRWNFIQHYKIMHPGVKMPFDFEKWINKDQMPTPEPNDVRSCSS